MAMTELSLDGLKVWVAGHRGMAGSALMRRLAREDCRILTATRAELDLRRQEPVERWLDANRPDIVIMAAATVGGIYANSSRPAEFIADNLVIQNNIIHGAHLAGVRKLLFLGSSCIYPRESPQPMAEESLLTGPPEPTNEWYAVAKIAGIKMCQAYRRQYGCDFIAAMPTNLYGPDDNFDLVQGHVAAAMIAKVHRAKQENAPELVIWGTGTPRREFLFADDLADGLVFLLKHYSDERHINVGTGIDISIRELADLVVRVAGYEGCIVHDLSKPDGMPRKVMKVDRINALGWRAPTDLATGMRQAYAWYCDNYETVRR